MNIKRTFIDSKKSDNEKINYIKRYTWFNILF